MGSRNIDGTFEEIPSRGFSDFTLFIDHDRVSLDGSLVGAGRLKQWLFDGDQAEASMLWQLAATHAVLGLEDAVPVLLDCAEAMDREQFVAKLESLRRV